MSRNTRNRRNNSQANQNDIFGENNDNIEYSSINSIFEEFFSRNSIATFLITFTAPNSRGSSFPGTPFPIFISRDIELRAPSNASESSSLPFSGFVKDFLNNLKRKERIASRLLKNKPFKFTKDMATEECTICLNDFKLKQNIRKLDCEHCFHKKCIDKWIIKGDNPCCPVCRKEPFSKED